MSAPCLERSSGGEVAKMDPLQPHTPMSPDGSILLREVEIHRLDLRYSHTRIMSGASICTLARSLDQFGQISPLVTVCRESLVLIDGYRRVAALKHNRQDTAMVELWPCVEHEAILRVLARSGERKWEAFEEAGLLRELLSGSELSRARVARMLGKDPSWVARRLDLLGICEEWMELIRSGKLSSWATSRVLVPLARANSAHALLLAGWIAREAVSTRDLALWFSHYQKSSNPTREKMIREPSLFLKAAQAKRESRQARALQEGPEGRWLHELGAVLTALQRLQNGIGALHGVDLTVCRQVLEKIKAAISSIEEQTGKDRP